MDHLIPQFQQYTVKADEPRKVETNNFRQVLEYFNEEGHLKNQPDKYYVAFAIPCAICQERNLALLNHYKTQRSPADHEAYAVLPCGHAFGYNCIHTWLRQDRTCPSCRRNPFGTEGFAMLDRFGDGAAREQPGEIKEIKALLQRPPPWQSETQSQPETQPQTQPQPQPQPQTQMPIGIDPIPRLRRGAISIGLRDRQAIPTLFRRESSDRPFDNVSDFNPGI